jgi:hypothetical protein
MRMSKMPGLAALSYLAMFLLLPLAAQEKVTVTPTDTLPAKIGERCTVCGAALDEESGVALIVRGRRVPLDKSMVETFMDDPQKYFTTKHPKSALFQEELSAPAGAALGGISSGWFLFGLYVLVALIFSGLSGYAAVSKGLSPIPHFFVGFFFSALGYLYVLTRPAAVKEGEIPDGLVKVPVTHAPVSCPQCGYANHPSAKTCANCGSKLQPQMESEVARAK